MGKIIFEDYPSTNTPLNANTLNTMQDELINLIYPIGSIFISAINANPSTYLGGTWEQIKDKFLLSAGDEYEAGSTGGESTHTLTIEEMPSHQHKAQEDIEHFEGAVYAKSEVGATTSCWGTSNGTYQYLKGINTSSTGGGKSHNNMPPYLTVYMWQRIA